tara:strand:+ start:375 stop:596 length:222 start_codon:yes stop_codon:yes gene_type:complete
MSKYDAVTVVNYTEDKKAEINKCIPVVTSLSNLGDTRFIITGSNLSDASGLYWQKLSGGGPSRIALMVSAKKQ